MIYVFDSGPLIDLFRHYYRGRFPSLWERFDDMVAAGRVISTREVFNELEGQGDALAQWCKENRATFPSPDIPELTFVSEIFLVAHFRSLVRKEEQLKGKPVADPFVIAKAKTIGNACVVTQEHYKPNAAKIPNVCKHFGIAWTSLEGFMEKENWSF